MTRSFTDRVLGGVCGGLAGNLPISAWAVRIFFIISAIGTLGLGLLLYLALWVMLPQESLIAPKRIGFLRFLGLLILCGLVITGWWGLVTSAYAPLLAQLPAGIADILGRALPILIVLIGLLLFLRGRIPLGGIASVLISAVLVGSVAMIAYSQRSAQFSTDRDLTLTMPFADGTTLLVVNISGITTEITVDSTDAQQVMLRFIGSSQSDIQPTDNFTQGIHEITFTEVQSSEFPSLNAVGRGRLEVTVPDDMPLVLNIVNVAGDVTLNVSDARLERVTLAIRQGNGVVSLPNHTPLSPNYEERPNTFNLASGDLTLFIPNTVDARLTYTAQGIPRQTTLPDTYFEAREAGTTTLRPNPDSFNIASAPRLYYEIGVPSGALRVQLREDTP